MMRPGEEVRKDEEEITAKRSHGGKLQVKRVHSAPEPVVAQAHNEEVKRAKKAQGREQVGPRRCRRRVRASWSTSARRKWCSGETPARRVLMVCGRSCVARWMTSWRSVRWRRPKKMLSRKVVGGPLREGEEECTTDVGRGLLPPPTREEVGKHHPKRGSFERLYDYVIACRSLQGKIKNMEVVEDFTSRPQGGSVKMKRRWKNSEGRKCKVEKVQSAPEQCAFFLREKHVSLDTCAVCVATQRTDVLALVMLFLCAAAA